MSEVECTRRMGCKCPQCDIHADMGREVWKKAENLAPEAAAEPTAAPAAVEDETTPAPQEVEDASKAAVAPDDITLPIDEAAVPAPATGGAEDADELCTQLPLGERLAHKIWKVRKAAFEAFATQLRNSGSDAASFAAAHGDAVAAALAKESNEAAITAGCAASTALFGCENLSVSQLKSCGAVALLEAVVPKGFGGRPGTQKAAQEAVLEAVAAGFELGEAAITVVVNNLSHKKAKVPPACVQCLTGAVKTFGLGVLMHQPIREPLMAKLTELVEGVKLKDAGWALVEELCRWMPADPIKQAMAAASKPKQTKLDAMLETAKPNLGQATATRSIRGAAGSSTDAAGASGTVSASAFIKAVDLVQLVSKKKFDDGKGKKRTWEQQATYRGEGGEDDAGKKDSWKKRASALDFLLESIGDIPKLEGSGADHADILATLSQLMKESSMPVVTKAMKSAASIAVGLGKEFSAAQAKAFAEAFLLQMKDKKSAILRAAFSALDDLCIRSGAMSLESDSLQRLIAKNLDATKTKAAHTRTNTINWLSAAVEADVKPKILSGSILSWMAETFAQALSDGDVKCRKAGLTGLKALIARCPESVEDKAVTTNGPIAATLSKLQKTQKKSVFDDIVGGDKKKAVKSQKPKRQSDSGSIRAAASGTGVDSKKMPSLKLKKKSKPQPVVQDTDSDTFSSPECALAKLADFGLSADQVEGEEQSLGSAKWQEQEKALLAMKAFVDGQDGDLPLGIPEAVLSLIHHKLANLKDFRHAVFKVMKVVLEIISAIATKCGKTPFPTWLVKHVVPAGTDKLGDKKLKAIASNMLVELASATSPKIVVNKVVAHLGDAKTPAVLTEGLNLQALCCREFGAAALDFDRIMDHAKSNKGLGSANKLVRTSAVELLSVLYHELGAAVRVPLEQDSKLSDSLKKTLFKNFDKVGHDVAAAASTARRTVRGGTNESESSAGESQALDVGDQIKAFLGDMSRLKTDDGKDGWSLRNAALQGVTKVFEATAPRCSNGKYLAVTPDIEELFTLLQARLKGETNINVKMKAVKCTGAAAVCLGPKGCVRFSKVVGEIIMKCASDNKKTMRVEALSTLDAWILHGGKTSQSSFESLLALLPEAMKRTVGRAEMLAWVARHAAACDLTAKAPLLEAMVEPLFACMQDKATDARTQAEVVLAHVTRWVDNEFVDSKLGDQRPAAVRTIRPIVMKLRGSAEVKDAPTTAVATKKSAAKKTSKIASDGKLDTVSRIEQKVEGVLRAQSARVPTEPTDNGALRKGNGKAKRAEKARRMKWTFDDQPSAEHRQELRDTMTKFVSPELAEHLFSDNFQELVSALKTLSTAVDELPDETVGNLDLLLKWCTLQLCENNTNVLNACLDYLIKLFNALGSKHYVLQDFEVEIFVPILVDKVGHNKARFRDKLRKIMRLIGNIATAPKFTGFVIGGWSSKNMRSRAACLEEVAELVAKHGAEVVPKKALQNIVRLADAPEKDVREASVALLVALQSAQELDQAVFFKQLGRVPAKVKDLVCARIKKCGTSKVKKSVRIATPKSEKPSDGSAPESAIATSKSRLVAPTPGLGANFRLATPCMVTPHPNAGPTPALRNLSPGDNANFDSPYVFDDSNITLDTPPLTLAPAGGFSAEALEQLFGEVLSGFDGLLSLYGAGARADNRRSPLYTQGRDALKMIFRISMAAAGSESESARAQAALLARHTDTLLAHITSCIRVSFEHSSTDIDANLLALALAVLSAMLKVSSVAAAMSATTLSETFEQIVTHLPDRRLIVPTHADSAKKLVAALNMVVLQAVEVAPRGAVFCALLQLLHRSAATSASCRAATASRDVQLVVRLFLKVIKLELKQDRPFSDVDSAAVIRELHTFFVAHPVQQPGDDAPFKAANTLLRQMLIQGFVEQHTSNLPADAPLHNLIAVHRDRIAAENTTTQGKKDESEQQALHSSSVHMSAAAAAPLPPPCEVTGADANAASERTDDELRSELALIYEKLQSNGGSDASGGVQDLHCFVKANPGVDVFAYLPHVSGAFKAYLNAELEKLACTGSTPVAAAHSTDANVDSGSQMTSSCSEGDRKENVDMPLSDKVSDLRARLQKCSKSPLASASTNSSDKVHATANTSAKSTGVADEQPATAKVPAVPAKDSMMSLRERLDALKQQK